MIEVLHGNRETPIYDPNIAVRLYYNNESENFPNHWQPSFEVIMPIENEYTIYIEDKKISLKPNEILLISPGILHRIDAPSSGSRYIMLFDSSYFSSVPGFEWLTTMFHPYSVFTYDNSNCLLQLNQYIKSISLEFQSNDSLKYASVYANLLQFLILAKRNARNPIVDAKEKKINSNKYYDIFESICEYIKKNCNSDISVNDLADMCSFSTSHFIRLFKQFTNVTYSSYINQCRISRAKQLIATKPELSITEVSLQSGFSSIATFNRLFKQYVNCSPTQYRNYQSL